METLRLTGVFDVSYRDAEGNVHSAIALIENSEVAGAEEFWAEWVDDADEIRATSVSYEEAQAIAEFLQAGRPVDIELPRAGFTEMLVTDALRALRELAATDQTWNRNFAPRFFEWQVADEFPDGAIVDLFYENLSGEVGSLRAGTDCRGPVHAYYVSVVNPGDDIARYTAVSYYVYDALKRILRR